jgi:pimeloyl-ACP methyl ester carboxylesterase
MEHSYPGAVGPERTRAVASQGIRIHVSEWGDPAAPPLVLTHGAFDHARGFDLLAPLLADDYRVVAVDQRGHGDSDWAGSYGWLNDLLDLAIVIRELGTPVFLLGHSKGGGQVMDVANMFPALVRRVVSLDGFGPPVDGFLADGRPPRDGEVPERFAEFLDYRRGAHDHGGWRTYPSVEELASRRTRQNPRLTTEWLNYFTACGARAVEGGFTWKTDSAVSRGFGPFKADWIAPGWATLSVPVLALYGAEPDTWSIPHDVMHDRLDHIPIVERDAVPDAGHFVHMEQPQATADRVRAFLEGDR